MGKGDKKSKKGKIAKGSYGNRRPHKANKKNAASEKQAAEK
ncbi:30S ribosomal protein THX [Pontibacter sp. Tf4]|nr:30S ribosomal protein THX [Pontibacter sp. Tf4]MBB6612968.1 30S ribosomal protein THX [Pontibacter sp. Tf4]